MTYSKPEVTGVLRAAGEIKGMHKTGAVVFDNRDSSWDLTSAAYESDE